MARNFGEKRPCHGQVNKIDVSDHTDIKYILVRTEKNATGWSKDKLKSLLTGLEVDGGAGVVELKDFKTLEGEASASNRKKKLIFFYEWDIKINWKGLLNNENMDEIEGIISIPNLSDEQDISDIDVVVAVTDSKPGADLLKELLRTRGADVIREKLANYVDALKQEFSQGMILPTANQDSASSTTSKVNTNLASEFQKTAINCSKTTPVTAVQISTKKISMKEEFMCSKEELYRALTEQNMVQAFTRAPPSKWQLEVGGDFVIFNGLISGQFQQLIPNDTIIQRWRMKNWPDGHHSIVTLKLSQSSNCTILTLSQTGVPSTETDSTKEGWRNYYFNSIRKTFGFTVNLF